jgi:asparagine synthase (glutamine-hydrolysing)
MLTTGTSPGALRNAARGPLARALDGYDPADAVRPHLERVPPDDAGLVNAMRYLDLKLTLAAGILTKVDRAAMSVSLETRPVLLNRGLLDLAGRIPPWQLADGAGTKKVLRHTVPDWLPPEVASRPKMGFAMPLGNWFQHDLRPLAAQAGSGPLAELIDPSYTSSVMHEHLSGHAERTAELHNLVFLNNWLEAWL